VISVLLIAAALTASARAANTLAPRIPVRVAFVEALAPRDTTSSERFLRDYERAIATAKSATEERLKGCGYELQTSTSFYDAGDPVQAREGAERSAKSGSWLIVGPRRSNHYLLLAQGAAQVPTVSLMASAKEVDELGPLHLSLSPTNSIMAKVAAAGAMRSASRAKRRTYLSVVNEDCVSCVDFAASFDVHAKKLGLNKLGELRVSGDVPETTAIRAQIEALKPGVVLLPNYSKSAAHVIAALEGVKTKPFFVGGDGWGDSKYGFIQNGEQLDSALGVTVRGLPPVEEGMQSFALGKRLTKSEKPGAMPWSGPGLAILRLLDKTADLLCQKRPSTADQFKEVFKQFGKKTYSAPWGVSVYQLEKGALTFQGMRKARL
jgi:hypothetical protein